MGQNTKIEWCNHTGNLWWGCTEVHTGCDNCYANVLSNRWGNDLWGNDKQRKVIVSAFKNLADYQKKAQKLNEVHTVFVGSMMDIFEKPMNVLSSETNTGIIRNHFFQNISDNQYPNLIFLLLTKRPSNINKYIPSTWLNNAPQNVYFGTSPVNQKTYDILTKQLLEVNGKRFLSIEPQLDHITLNNVKGIDWVIQGGESGHKRRPFKIRWAKQMRDECKELNIPYFFKQIDKVKKIPKSLEIRLFPF